MYCPACGQKNPESAQFCNGCGARLVRHLDNSGAPNPEGISASGFIGRHRELAEITAALKDSLSGRGRLVMLVGEPGIGKTRTILELAALAQSLNARVLWGRCYDEEGAPPYWPWVQLVRSYIQETDAAELESEMGSGASYIAEIIPELRGKLPGLEPLPVLEPEQARFRLFDSLTSFLKNAAQNQPLILVLDDLHWADTPSLLMLQFLAREIANSRLLVIGAYRDVELSRQHPLSEALGGLAREQLYQRVPLRGLAAEELALLVQEITGIVPSPGFTLALQSHTEGNPFFAVEVVRLLEQEDELTAESLSEPRSWRISIPEGVREVIGRRLNRLSPQCNRVLTIAAVIGREFQLKQLGHLVQDLSEEGLLEALEEALASRVIEELSGSATGYQFSHALIQETLTSELSAARRVRLHAQIAQMLEQLYGDNLEAHASQLAYHFAEAEPALGTDKLVHYALIAGEQALAAYAYEEALAHFERGLAARCIPLVGAEPAPDAEAAALLVGLGQAQVATMERHKLREAVVSLSRAFDFYAEMGNVDRAVAIAEYPFFPVSGQRIGLAPLIARALSLVAPDSHEAGRLLSHYGAVLELEEGDYQRAQQSFQRALDIARRNKDLALEMSALSNAARVDYYHLNYTESLDKSRQAIALARYVDDPSAQVIACENAASTLLRTGGQLEEARQRAADALVAARQLRDRSKLAQAFWVNAAVAAQAGEWEEARELSDRGLGVSPLYPPLLFNRALLEYEVGNFAEGAVHLQRLRDATHSHAVPESSSTSAFCALIMILAHRITGSAISRDEAETMARGVVLSPLTPRRSAMLAREALGLIAVLQGDHADAPEQYDALYSIRGVILTNTLATDRLLGLLSQTIGDPDLASAHFEDALAFCRKAGYRPELAWTCYDYANLFQEIGQNAKALVLLNEALATSVDLAMKPLMERIITLRELALSQPAKTPAYPDALTQREVEVLRLVASGKTSTEIAAELVLSRRTVERHISNIYNKTNTHSRAEATAFAYTSGLASSS